MLLKLLAATIMLTLDDSVLDGAVRLLLLAVGPEMLWRGEPVFDIIPGVGVFKEVSRKRSPKMIASLISSTADLPTPGMMR